MLKYIQVYGEHPALVVAIIQERLSKQLARHTQIRNQLMV
jgi:hypothetical protein